MQPTEKHWVEEWLLLECGFLTIPDNDDDRDDEGEDHRVKDWPVFDNGLDYFSSVTNFIQICKII